MSQRISEQIATLSIAQRDKQLLDLEKQIELKTAQLKQDYNQLQRDVKHNPYLQVAIDEYKTYFAKVKTDNNNKVKALTTLLKDINNPMDTIDIKREIKHIKQKI